MKYLCLLTLLFPLNIFAEHLVCIAIYPTPPECLHDDRKSDDDNLLLGAVLIVGGYYLLRGQEKSQEEFDAMQGINIYRTNKFEINALALDQKNHANPKKIEFKKVEISLLSVQYRLD